MLNVGCHALRSVPYEIPTAVERQNMATSDGLLPGYTGVKGPNFAMGEAPAFPNALVEQTADSVEKMLSGLWVESGLVLGTGAAVDLNVTDQAAEITCAPPRLEESLRGRVASSRGFPIAAKLPGECRYDWKRMRRSGLGATVARWWSGVSNPSWHR